MKSKKYGMMNVCDLKFYDEKTNEFLFEVLSAKTNRIESDVYGNKFILEDVLIDANLINNIGNGEYFKKKIRAEGYSHVYESETNIQYRMDLNMNRMILDSYNMPMDCNVGTITKMVFRINHADRLDEQPAFKVEIKEAE